MHSAFEGVRTASGETTASSVSFLSYLDEEGDSEPGDGCFWQCDDERAVDTEMGASSWQDEYHGALGVEGVPEMMAACNTVPASRSVEGESWECLGPASCLLLEVGTLPPGAARTDIACARTQPKEVCRQKDVDVGACGRCPQGLSRNPLVRAPCHVEPGVPVGPVAAPRRPLSHRDGVEVCGPSVWDRPACVVGQGVPSPWQPPSDKFDSAVASPSPWLHPFLCPSTISSVPVSDGFALPAAHSLPCYPFEDGDIEVGDLATDSVVTFH